MGGVIGQNFILNWVKNRFLGIPSNVVIGVSQKTWKLSDNFHILWLTNDISTSIVLSASKGA